MCETQEEREPLRALSLGDIVDSAAISLALQALTNVELMGLREVYAALQLHHSERGPGECPLHRRPYRRLDAGTAARYGWGCDACFDVAARLQVELRRRPRCEKRRWYRNS